MDSDPQSPSRKVIDELRRDIVAAFTKADVGTMLGFVVVAEMTDYGTGRRWMISASGSGLDGTTQTTEWQRRGYLQQALAGEDMRLMIDNLTAAFQLDTDDDDDET